MDYQLAINILSKKMGVLLRSARTQRGESKKTCGEVLGVTSRTINKYEMGEKSPSLPELEVLAYYLDVPLERFWEDMAPETQDKMDSLKNLSQRLELRNLKIGASIRKFRQDANLSMKEVSERFVDSGPIAEWAHAKKAGEAFTELPLELQEFILKPVNQPYLEIAQKLSQMSVDKMRDVAEGLLDITL